MPRIPFVLPIIILVASALTAGQDAAPADKPLTQDERSMDWLIAIERLRTLPRAGDIQNAAILANIGDVVETTPEQKAAIAAALKAYDAALVQKTAQWENEMKAVRAEYEAKIVAALPEARRDAAKNALDFSHEKWVTPFEFEAQLRAEYVHKRLASEDKKTPVEELDALKKELQSWIKEQRQKATKKNNDIVEKLKALLDPKEAARLNDFDKNKEAPPKEVKKAK